MVHDFAHDTQLIHTPEGSGGSIYTDGYVNAPNQSARLVNGSAPSLQRTPTDRELAVELKIGLPELRELYAQLQLTSVVALDELIAAGRSAGGAGATLAESLPDEGAEDPISTLVDQDSRRELADAIAQLAERDRVVVTLYYFEDLTLAEIGKVLGVTESRALHLHTRAVLRLRSVLCDVWESG